MENYKIVSDEKELDSFIEWLPDLTEEETFYFALFTRKKYYVGDHPWVKSDKNHLRRGTSPKERLKAKLYQLECPLGRYTTRGKGDTEFIVPQESLVVYIHPNPRNNWKATIASLIDLAKVVQCNGKNSNPHQEVLSSIQRTPSYKRVVTFDIDEKDDKVLDDVIDICGTAADVVETRGGYHVLVHSKEMPKQTKWYQELSKFADVTGDAMLPIPGCIQGGFTPKFVIKNH